MVRISCKNLIQWTYLSLIISVSFYFNITSAERGGYYGKFIGKLTEFHHGVSGEVYAVDARTLHLRNFNYDGEGPAAYFYVGNSKGPGVNGIRIRDERGTTNVLPKYRNSHITLTLPEGKTLQNIRWFSVWCDEFSVNFGDVRISKTFDFPRPQKINGLSGVHGVSSDPIVIVDAQTLLIPNFSYDGEAPDAKFWVGRGHKPSPQGIRLPDENGKYNPLRLYDRKTIVLTLPGDLTVFDIGHFGVWCEAFTVDFGHVQIPSGLNVPPSLKMLGVSPQKRSRSLAVPLIAQNQFGRQDSSEQSVNNPIFYQDFKAQTNAVQHIRPTTYRPPVFRPVQQRNDNFQIQRSISLPGSNEFVINEQTGDFVRKPLDAQHNRHQQARYEPTPAEKILQHNPAEPGSQPVYQNNGILYTPQPVTIQPSPVFIGQVQPQRHQLLPPPQYHQIPLPPVQPQFVQPQQPPFVQHQQHQYIQHQPTQQHFPQQQQIYQPQQRPQLIPPQHFVQQQHPGHLVQPHDFRRRADNNFGPVFLQQPPQSKLNCEVLWDQLAFEVRWAVAGDSIVLQLVAKLENGEYMAFGLSGDDRTSQMVGGDVTVAWVDKDTFKGHAFDYYLDAKSQCSGGRGSCPDEKIAERTNSVRLLNAALVNGYSIVTYQRSLKPQDELDLPIYTNGSQPIIWAIGPLNSLQEVSYHSLANRGNVFIDFGRSPKWNCPTPESNAPQSDAAESPSNNHNAQPVQYTKQQRIPSDARQPSSNRQDTRTAVQVPTPAPVPKTKAWEIPAIQCDEPEDGVFYAQMGPTGGKRGYSAITGHVGWGISWYINGLLIPEINVVRGRTYTFIVEGGLDPEIPARYHPFYITDDPVGGYEHKTPEERANIQIFAGAVQNKRGEVRPTGVGRLCNWTPDPNHSADDFASFGAYQRTLRLECDQGEPGIIQWTVDRDTPDTVYYQCYSHRYLGWKINVLDHCDAHGAGSDPVPSVVKAPSNFRETLQEGGEEEGQETVIRSTRVKPDFGSIKGADKYPTVNNTQIFSNEFVRYQPQVTYVPEFTFYNEDTGEPLSTGAVSQLKSQEEIARLKAQYALKDPLLKQQAIQQSQQILNVHGLQGLQTRPESHQTLILQPSSQQKIIPLDIANMKNEEFINFFHGEKIKGQAHPEISPQHFNYKVEVMLPTEGNSHPETEIISSSDFRINTDLQPKPSFQIDTVKLPELKNQAQFNNELLKGYQILKVQAEENAKKHKQKLQIYNKPTNRLPNGQIIGGQNRLQFTNNRKPSLQHAVTLQQRPLPPGVFRPPFLPPPISKHGHKRPQGGAAFNGPSFAGHHRPVSRKPQKPFKIPPLEIQQYVSLQKQLESLVKPHESNINASPLLNSSPVVQDKQVGNVPLAVNTGFDPDSVKVEGGFKPILNTGIAPKYNVLERADGNIEEGNDEKIGVIDLTKDVELGEKDALFKDTKEELIKVEEPDAGKRIEEEDKDSEDLDLFKNQEPQMFEPIFIPSPPDNRMQKYQEKHKKKPITKYHELNMKYRNDHLQYYNTNKNGNHHIKIRPRPNLIRRPLYPDNVIPPFKIPVRGGAPQYRYQHLEESLENADDFDIIRMSNNSATTNDSKAENILEIIEMAENDGKDNSTEGALEAGSESNSSAEKSSTDDEDEIAEDEMAMADNRSDFYVSPKDDGVLTFDGKVVKADPAPMLPPDTNPDISKLPQFGPFKGETPPLTPESNNSDQVSITKTANHDILPPSAQSTKLSRATVDLYEPQSSEIQDTIVRAAEIHDVTDVERTENEKTLPRRKRSPDHIPGHVGHHDHDHDHEHDHDHDHNHDHDHHNHHQHSKSNSASKSAMHIIILTLITGLRFL